MSDGYIHNSLVERLRGKYSYSMDGIKEDRQFGTYTPLICEEAAGVIEQQAETIERLRAAISNLGSKETPSDIKGRFQSELFWRGVYAARDALNKLEAGEL